MTDRMQKLKCETDAEKYDDIRRYFTNVNIFKTHYYC